jgi:GNAT superfamily N-acetyltransferase
MAELHFTENYCETALLRDNRRVALRLVQPGDKALLRKGLQRMSKGSRYRRFLAVKNRLSDAELAYLTECDGYNHLALGAVVRDAEGHEEGVGVARFIRSTTDAGCAEAAIAVVDDWQNKGVGTLLLMRLAAAAKERGIDRFRGSAFAENAPVREILKQLGPSVRTAGDGEELQIEVDLPDVPHDAILGWPEHPTPLRQLLSLTAKGAILVRRVLSRHESSPQVQGEGVDRSRAPAASRR